MQSLMDAAGLEIRRRTGKTRVVVGSVEQNIDTDPIWAIAIKLGVADMYENRGSDAVGVSVAQYSKTFNSIIQFISVCGDYV